MSLPLPVRNISGCIYQKYNVILTAVGIYSINTTDEEIIHLRKEILEYLKKNPYFKQMHGFFMNKEENFVRFDIIISFDAKDRLQEYRRIRQEIIEAYPQYHFSIVLDTDYN